MTKRTIEPAAARLSGALLRRVLGSLLAIALALAVFSAGPAHAAPTSQQRTKARVAESALKRAQGLNKSKKYKESAAALKQAQSAITELGSDPEGAKLVAGLYPQLEMLHGDLELQGVKLDALPPAPAMAADSGPATGGKTAGGVSGGVSFSKQVAPMLVEKCGNCHVRGSKGEFNFVSFTALMKGSKDGIVISPKSSDGSRIVEVIRSGDMPRGGGKVSPEQLAMLSKWIDEGAKFDGSNPDANIADPNLIAAQRDGMSMDKVQVAMATGKETVSFALDIAPVLVSQCYGCHGEGRQPRARYDMDTFKGVLKGGESGEAVSAGKPDQSLMIAKIRGTAKDGVRMPKDAPPLSPDVIAKFEKWVAEGARFDGYDVASPVGEVAAIAHAEHITPEQLAKERSDLGAHNWKLVLPDGGDDRFESDNFIVFGNTGKESLQETARIAEEQGAKLQKMMKLPTGPLIKGRTTIFVFDKKYDYGEVGRMLEGRELPPELRAHWRYTTVDAYICAVPPKNKEYSYSALIGQQLAGIMVANQGHMPRWFAEGSARNLAARLDPKDTRYKQWEDIAREAVASGVKPEGFLTGSGPDNDAIAYMFVKQLLSDAGRYQKLMTALKAKTPFEAAFTQAYGMPPAQAVAKWSGK